jgi:hypothetical protein
MWKCKEHEKFKTILQRNKVAGVTPNYKAIVIKRVGYWLTDRNR